MAKHILKTDPAVFSDVYNGLKNFEIRKNDRDFKESDILILRETEFSGAEMADGIPMIYTGREIECEVNYILHGPVYGLMEGWVIMGIEVMDHSSMPIKSHADHAQSCELITTGDPVGWMYRSGHHPCYNSECGDYNPDDPDGSNCDLFFPADKIVCDHYRPKAAKEG